MNNEEFYEAYEKAYENENLVKQIEAVQDGQLEQSGLVRAMYEVARKTSGKFVHEECRRNFIALNIILGTSTDEQISPALKQAYIDECTEKHSNVVVDLRTCVNGMKELGVSDEEIADYIVKALDSRISHHPYGTTQLECVSIPFVKAEPVKTKIKDHLHRLQRETAEADKVYGQDAGHIQKLFRDCTPELYELATTNKELGELDDFRYDNALYHNSRPELSPGQQLRREELLRQMNIAERLEMSTWTAPMTRSRAVNLAQLDLVLDSDYLFDKNDCYFSLFYYEMRETAKAIKAPEEVITQIETTARLRGQAGRLGLKK